MVVSDRFDKGKNSISYKNIFSYHNILVGPKVLHVIQVILRPEFVAVSRFSS